MIRAEWQTMWAYNMLCASCAYTPCAWLNLHQPIGQWTQRIQYMHSDRCICTCRDRSASSSERVLVCACGCAHVWVGSLSSFNSSAHVYFSFRRCYVQSDLRQIRKSDVLTNVYQKSFWRNSTHLHFYYNLWQKIELCWYDLWFSDFVSNECAEMWTHLTPSKVWWQTFQLCLILYTCRNHQYN